MNPRFYKEVTSVNRGQFDIDPSVKFGKNFWIGKGCIIEEDVVIGDDCWFAHKVHIRPNSKIGDRCGLRIEVLIDPDVVLGDDVQVYPKAIVGGGTKVGNNVYYGPMTLTTNSSEPGVIDPPEIGDNCIIYAGCMIGPGVKVRPGTIVGMNSTLTKSTGQMEVWYGDQARLRRAAKKRDFGISDDSPWPYSILNYMDELNNANEKDRGNS